MLNADEVALLQKSNPIKLAFLQIEEKLLQRHYPDFGALRGILRFFAGTTKDINHAPIWQVDHFIMVVDDHGDREARSDTL